MAHWVETESKFCDSTSINNRQGSSTVQHCQTDVPQNTRNQEINVDFLLNRYQWYLSVDRYHVIPDYVLRSYNPFIIILELQGITPKQMINISQGQPIYEQKVPGTIWLDSETHMCNVNGLQGFDTIIVKQLSHCWNEMKCGLFNDPFDYYGHIGSGNGNRLHKLFGERPWGVGWGWNDEGWHIPKISPQSVNRHERDSNHEPSDL